VESARLATEHDRDAILRLGTEARHDAAGKRGGVLLVDHELATDPWSATHDADDAFVVVGLVDEVPVGYAVVHIERLRTADALGIIDELFVHPDARSVGVGEAMMDLVVARCTEAGCIGLDARALPGDRATKNFFETFGLVARAIVVHRRLPGADPVDPVDPAGRSAP
jgi:GNAT superfamily N-acetyltransferase